MKKSDLTQKKLDPIQGDSDLKQKFFIEDPNKKYKPPTADKIINPDN